MRIPSEGVGALLRDSATAVHVPCQRGPPPLTTETTLAHVHPPSAVAARQVLGGAGARPTCIHGDPASGPAQVPVRHGARHQSTTMRLPRPRGGGYEPATVRLLRFCCGPGSDGRPLYRMPLATLLRRRAGSTLAGAHDAAARVSPGVAGADGRAPRGGEAEGGRGGEEAYPGGRRRRRASCRPKASTGSAAAAPRRGRARGRPRA